MGRYKMTSNLILISSPILVGGIGEVSTKPKYTGKKLASTLLLKATDYMETNKFDISSLHTGEAAPLYASVGWKSVPRHFVKRLISDISPTESPLTVSSIDFKSYEKLAQMEGMYENYAKKFNGNTECSL
jgi:predicted acetyltransferase